MRTHWLPVSLLLALPAWAPSAWAQGGARPYSVFLPTPTPTPEAEADAPAVSDRDDDEEREKDERRARRRRHHKGDVRFGSSVKVASGETNHKEIVVMGGNAEIHGRQRGDVVVIGGSGRVSGEVDGDVVVIGGPLDLESTANIDGDAVTVGGPLRKEEGATVSGETVSMAGVRLPALLLPGFSWDGDFDIGRLWLMAFGSWVKTAVLAFLLTIVIVAVVPARVEAAAGVLRERWAAAFGAGILTWIATWLLAGLLVLTCIGCVLAPLPFVFYKVAKYFGLASLFFVVGQAMGRTAWSKELTLLPSLLLGYLLLAVIGLILPPAWWIYEFLGAGCAILTRFGTLRPWFRPATPMPPPPPSTTLAADPIV